MQQKKSKRKPPSEKQVKKRNRVIFRIVLICLAFYGVISIVQLQNRIAQKEAEVSQMRTKIQQQTENNDALREQVEKGLSDEQIAAIAREQGYIMPSERVFAYSSSK